MTDPDTVKILEKIREDLHKTHIKVTEIQGDSKLQMQTLNFHIGQLKEFKQEVLVLISGIDTDTKNLTVRVEKLEKWQTKVMAIAAAVGASISIGLTSLKDFIIK